MHRAVTDYVNRFTTLRPKSIVEIGSRDINGSARRLFPETNYTGLDLYPGPAVDWVGNACEYNPPEPVDLVLCLEVLEHAPDWQDVIAAASRMLKTGGAFVMTCAGPGRKTHSAVDGKALRDGEYYQNLSRQQIGMACFKAGLAVIDLNTVGNDTQCCAVRA